VAETAASAAPSGAAAGTTPVAATAPVAETAPVADNAPVAGTAPIAGTAPAADTAATAAPGIKRERIIPHKEVETRASSISEDGRERSEGAVARPLQTQRSDAKNDIVRDPNIDYLDEQYTNIRAVIAKTMTASLSRSAQLTHHHSFDATSILAMREDFKRADERLGWGGVSVGDMILYVVSRILTNHPEINALVAEGGVRRYFTVNLGVAVDTPRGLMVPTVFGAEKKTLREISGEVKELAAAAREGRISPDRLGGGTFTVSNLGATGVEIFTPIINPPQAAILGVCGVTDRVRVGRDGKPEVYHSIGISLTYDHRAVDGAPAPRFAAELCEALATFSWKTIALESESSAQ